MKCAAHADQAVIMVCRDKQCQSCFVCVLCIAGSHNGHKMATLEEAGKASKKRLKDSSKVNVSYLEDQKTEIEKIDSMEQATSRKQKELRQMTETQGKELHETVDKVISHTISQYEEKYETRLRKLKSIKGRTKEAIAKVKSSEDGTERILKTDDWLQIIEHEKKSMKTPKVESPPKDTTPDIRTEEINKTLVTGVLSALQQCGPRGTVVDEDTSDFVGTVYSQKSLKSVSSFSPGLEGYVRCVASCRNGLSYIAVCGEKEIYVCDKQGEVIRRLACKSEPCGMVITDDKYLLVSFYDKPNVKKMTLEGKQLDTFSTDPLLPNQICVANNGDILVTLVSSFDGPPQNIVGAVSRYTPQGKRMVTFERDRFGNTIRPKYIAASRVSDIVVITTHTNKDGDRYRGHVIVMTGDLQVTFRYLSDGRVIPGDQQYHSDISTKHFCVAIDSNDNIILGDVVSESIEIIDRYGHKVQSLGQVDGLANFVLSSQDEMWIGKKKGQVELFKYT